MFLTVLTGVEVLCEYKLRRSAAVPYTLLSVVPWVLVPHGEPQEQETALQASCYTVIKI